MPKATEITMPRYADWRPSAHDAKGLALDDRQDWLVCPVSINRDTEDPLTLSNWHSFVSALSLNATTCEDFEIHRFGHWGPGWFEIILVRPDTAAAIAAQEMADALESYPVLDEHDYSEREMEAEQEAWQGLSVKERLALLKRTHYKGSCLAARRDYPPHDDNGAIRESLLGY